MKFIRNASHCVSDIIATMCIERTIYAKIVCTLYIISIQCIIAESRT